MRRGVSQRWAKQHSRARSEPLLFTCDCVRVAAEIGERRVAGKTQDWKIDMTYDITRARVIQMWFSALIVIAAFWFAFGTAIGAGTAALLVGLSVVPPAILLILWPGVQPLTAAEVIRGTEPR